MPLKNFAYAEFEFESYPARLAQHKVFCTLSDLEGGPVPLLESLVAGLSVVATDTGTARDLTPASCRKFILPINPTVEMISQSEKLAAQNATLIEQTDPDIFAAIQAENRRQPTA